MIYPSDLLDLLQAAAASACSESFVTTWSVPIRLPLGITDAVLSAPDHSLCRTIGGAVSWLGHGGMLVPSARRSGGTNLVIYQRELSSTEFDVMGEEAVAHDVRP
jgi:hypothetical protein